jgi:hypothetical protein
MKKPPLQKTTQTDFVSTAVRIPADLHNELKEAALHNGRSMNAEIIARLRSSPIDDLKRQVMELKGMIREALDRI